MGVRKSLQENICVTKIKRREKGEGERQREREREID